MATYAVRYSQPLLGSASPGGALAGVPGASVLVRRNGVATTIYADRAKTSPVATGLVTAGVAPGAVGLDTTGNLVFWIEPGSGIDYVVTVGASSSIVAVPTLSADLDEPIPPAAVEEAMLAFGVARQDELDAAVAALTTALAGKATPAQIDAAVAALVDSSPELLNTLNEFAAALGDDANFAATMTTALAGKQATIPAGTYAEMIALAGNPDLLIAGAITRDANDAATSAPVQWPNGQPGTYTATSVSTAFPGAVDAYTITYGSPVTRTYTQPAVTRNATGAVTNRPVITVA